MVLQGDALAVLKTLPAESVDMCVTSPPYYGLRDYGVDGQIGLEETPEAYIDRLVSVFREVRRVMKDDGTLWVNVGDSYCASKTGSDGEKSTLGGGKKTQKEASKRPSKKPNMGLKSKDLIGIPWMLAFALRSDGWYLRQDIIWHKPNPMPESVKDRCTKSHEYIFLLSKSPKYYFDYEAIQEESISSDTRPSALIRAREKDYQTKDALFPEAYLKPKHPIGGVKRGEQGDEHYRTASGNEWIPTVRHKNIAEKGQRPNSFHLSRAEGMADEVYQVRNKRDVWKVATKPYSGAHFATFPEALIEPCILAGSRGGGTVLDPFNGAATTGVVCLKTGREYIGIELNPEYVAISNARLAEVQEQVENEKAQMCLFGEGG